MTQPVSQTSRRDASHGPEADHDEALVSKPLATSTPDPRVSGSPRPSREPPDVASHHQPTANLAILDAARHASEAAKRPGANTGGFSNAARTTERDVTKGPYVQAGWTHDGGSAFVGVALAKGQLLRGMEEEVASASVQVGRQNEAQVGFVRAGVQGAAASLSGEGLTAAAHAGVDNADGSVGLNVGATASWASVEATVKHAGSSVTLGASAGGGLEGHVGVRDDDKDGRVELCGRLAAGPVILGACVEMPWTVRP